MEDVTSAGEKPKKWRNNSKMPLIVMNRSAFIKLLRDIVRGMMKFKSLSSKNAWKLNINSPHKIKSLHI
jgi:hypothetical protein